ncbi:hypothetical protein [Microbacterium invictum]|uniref:Uncharacterized protein n=1 Tax=Microbacterium invictum TaxID=515415 RepID=A0AA40SMQ8_9MICO|nr:MULTISPECIES: hypothetical protein [Microbacterium]MBB4139090.1 hypothetical protein [Microbacterium invictum]
MRGGVRPLLIAAAIGLGTGALAGVLLTVIGFGLRLDVWVLVGLVTAVAVWFFRDVFDSGQEEPLDEPQEPAPAFWSLDLDRRTRTLEAQLRGAERGTGTSVTTLHRTIEKIAHATDGPLPPATARYLASEPRPLTRGQRRTIIRELMQR